MNKVSRDNFLRSLLFGLLALVGISGWGEVVVSAEFYFSSGCNSCIRFLEREVPRINNEHGIVVDITEYDLLDPVAFERLHKRLDDLGIPLIDVPVFALGSIALQGDKEIKSELPILASQIASRTSRGIATGDAVKELADLFYASKSYSQFSSDIVVDINSCTDSQSEGFDIKKAIEEIEAGVTETPPKIGGEILAAPVIFAGLLDGINPCAFTTLIFLLAALALAGRSRREILMLGLFFTLSVFVTYFLIGLGFFQAVRAASVFPVIGRIIRWVLFAVLVVFAVLSIYDWRKIRAGKPSEILLQLPMVLKQKIHASIRTYARSTALAGSAIAMGFFVSVFELACTGQVYFPTLTYLARVEGGTRSYLFLGLYNVGFIAPLLVVFGLSYAGVSSQRITRIFQTHLGTVKLGTAALFVGLAVLTVMI